MAKKTIYKHVFYYDGSYRMMECLMDNGPMWGHSIHYVEPDGTERRISKNRVGLVVNASRQHSYHVLLDTDDYTAAHGIVMGYLKKKVEEHRKKLEFYQDILKAFPGKGERE